MASELIVQTIQGPSSGANANKVLIPSGHTLDVSGGTLTPSSGQAVQIVRYWNGWDSQSTTSTSLVASSVQGSITPIYDNSLILIDVYTSMSHAGGSYPLEECKVYVDAGSGYSALSGSGQWGHTYVPANGYQPSCSFSTYTATSTNQLNFKLYYRTTGTGTAYIVHPSSSWGVTLTEIKQ